MCVLISYAATLTFRVSFMELMASKGVILELFLVKVAKLPLVPRRALEVEERASPHVHNVRQHSEMC